MCIYHMHNNKIKFIYIYILKKVITVFLKNTSQISCLISIDLTNPGREIPTSNLKVEATCQLPLSCVQFDINLTNP